MTGIRSMFTGPIFESSIEERKPSDGLVSYALELATLTRAHLAIGLGSCKFAVPSAGVIRAASDIISTANRERGLHAERYGADLLTRCHTAGIEASLELIHADYGDVADRFVRLARVADLAIMEAGDEVFSPRQGVLQTVLFESGRPVVVVPGAWAKGASFEHIVVSWDGSAKAARAVGDAMPLLEQAKTVEIVAVGGDPDSSKRVEGAELATHLARHCKDVVVTDLPSRDGDIAQTLRNHLLNRRASMLVMGAFAHSRVRQFVLGGVTRSILADPPVPVLMSY